MAIFIRLSASRDKHEDLSISCASYRIGEPIVTNFEIDPEEFKLIPGTPFAYWTSDAIRGLFLENNQFESGDRCVKVGLQTSDDTRFVRIWTEVDSRKTRWIDFSKGGAASKFYADVSLKVNAEDNFSEIVTFQNARYPYLNGNARSFLHADMVNFMRPGITWPLRSANFSPRVLPSNCIYSVRGYAAFTGPGEELATLSIFNTPAFDYLFKVALGRFGFPEFLVGVLQKMPWRESCENTLQILSKMARRSWSLKRTLDTVEETSHAFLLPRVLRARLGGYDPTSIEAELVENQAQIDDIAFELFGFSDTDREAALGTSGSSDQHDSDGADDADENEDNDGAEAVDQTDGLLSWAAGVAFGRFDWRLATGEREAPPEPDPFDPLPAKSPGMLPDGAEPFHAHSGILVDDQGHPHDLARLIEEVLARVDAPVPPDVRRWLQRDFFKFHLGQYSKSRRKAPIYWPISTSSGSYTLWLYYPSLTDQTLFTAVNDFIEPKLKQVGQDVAALRTKGSARSLDDEKNFEALQALELELTELRDTLLAIANTYRPNHDDGVQITAAPLWQLFRHKPWQKILKDTWAKLEKGDYDWAHLAIAYWPDRVREKCKTDKSLAIAHELEHLYVEPEPTKARGRKKAG